MTFADQDENNNQVVPDVAADTVSEADGECDSAEQGDSDQPAGECDSAEQSDSDQPEEAPESCDDGCGCSDSADDDTAAAVSDFPVASLEMLLMTHHTQAVMALGMMPDPLTGETSANKNAAKFHIDMLSLIEEKTKGNLSSEEAESLSSILHQLRMAFFAA